MQTFHPSLLVTALVVVSGSVRAGDALQHFDIAAQNLGPALQKLAAQSGASIFYAAASVAGRKAQALKGQFSTGAALAKLLSGSGLVYNVAADGSISVKPAPPQLNQADPATMPTVKVSGAAIYETTDPYNEDYVLPNATVGTKTDTPVMATPLNIQVISKQVLKDQQVVRLDQALKNISGVTTNSSPVGSSGGAGGTSQTITLRGFASETYFRNGFRLQGGTATRAMANVEAVEVLKGPAAILYGLVEPGGMVNLVTKQPLATPYYALQQQFGSYDFYRTTVDAGGPLSHDDTLLYRVNLSYENSGSYREFIENENVFFAPVVKWNISPRTQVTMELEYSHDKLGLDSPFVPMLDGRFISIPRSRNYLEPATGYQDTVLGGLNWSHQFNDDWAIKHSFVVNQQASDRLSLIPFTPQFSPNLDQITQGLYQTNNTMNTYSTNIDLTGHFDTAGLRHTILLGGDYYRVDKAYNRLNSPFSSWTFVDIFNPVHAGLPNAGQVIDPTTKFISTQTTDQYGVYLQDQIKLPYNFHFTGGLRYQYLHQSGRAQMPGYGYDAFDPTLTADAVTPRVGLLWQPRNWLSLYSNYAENFGANPGYKIYVDGVNDKAAPPTGAQQWEIGVKTAFFDDRLRATLAYYDLTKQNVVSNDPDPTHVGYALVTGEVNSSGPELDIQGEILPGWNMIATYAYTDVTVTKGNASGTNNDYPAVGSRYYGVPRNTASVWSTYEFQQAFLQGFKFGGGVTVRDGQLACCTNTPVSGYTTVDLLAAYSLKVGKSKVTAQLNINNLLDEYYLSAVNVDANMVAPGYDGAYASFGTPRTVMGSINIQY